jgi:hypothetical protein
VPAISDELLAVSDFAEKGPNTTIEALTDGCRISKAVAAPLNEDSGDGKSRRPLKSRRLQ